MRCNRKRTSARKCHIGGGLFKQLLLALVPGDQPLRGFIEMKNKSHLAIARHQLAATGMSIIDRETLHAAMPSAWASDQESMLVGDSLRSMVSALRAEHAGCWWFECLLNGRAVLGLARSLEGIEQRALYLTGKTCAGVKPIKDPLSTLAVETSRVQEIRAPEKADDLAGFDLAEALDSLPHHLCASRATTLDKVETYWLRHPEAYTRTGVYIPGEVARHDAVRAKLKQAHPAHDFGPDEINPPTYSLI